MPDKIGNSPDKVLSIGNPPTERRPWMQLITDLQACLDRQPDDSGRWVGQMIDQLPVLAKTMRDQFEEEEGGKLYSEISRRRPQVAARLEDLKGEHPVMLTEIDKIIDVVNGMRDAELNELGELNARIQLLVARLRRHETAENELIYDVYWNDIGAGD